MVIRVAFNSVIASVDLMIFKSSSQANTQRVVFTTILVHIFYEPFTVSYDNQRIPEFHSWFESQ